LNPVSQRRALIALMLAAGLLLFARLGATGLWAPDEPRFGQVAEEMRSMRHGATGLVLLHLNDEVYTQKPPLYYWAAALVGAVQGRVTEWGARLPSALAGLACIWLCVRFGTLLGGRPAVGWWSGAILLSVYRFGHVARRAQLDIILCFFMMLALYAWWQFLLSERRATASAQQGMRGETRWIILLHVSLGLAVLTKGPVGLLPLAIITLHLLWEGEPGRLRSACPPWGLALSLGPPLAWIASAVLLAPTGYFQHAVVDNVFGRFFSGTAHVRPVYYFFYQFPLEFLPWTLLWPAAGRLAWRQLGESDSSSPSAATATRFLLVWVGTLFVFFTLSAGKRGLYLLPAYPAAAILCAAALEQGVSGRTRLPSWIVFPLTGVTLAAGMAGLTIAFAGGLELEAFPGFALPARFGVLLAAICLLALVGSHLLRRLGWSLERRLMGLVAALLALELLVFAAAYPAFDDEKSPRGIAQLAARLTPTGEPIGIFDEREMVGGVRYYSDRPVVALAPGDAIVGFLADGGRSIIVKQQKLEWLRESGPFVVLGHERSGARRLLLVRPSGGP
jgi:4-amino-4-deoxy-L-arabinose transferase-like glycosyltransferase